MINKEKTVIGYVALNPLLRVEAYLVPEQINPESLQEFVDSQCVLMVEYSDETRDYVTPEEIIENHKANVVVVHLVEQEVFVPLMNALSEVLAETYTPVATLSVNSKSKQPSKLEKFQEALAAMNERYLKNIEGDEDADA